MAQAVSTGAGDMLAYEDAAEYLGISVSRLKQAISEGKIQTVKLPKIAKKFIRREELDNYKARRWTRAPIGAAPAAAMAPSSPADMQDPARLREMVSALSGPTLEALREAQTTARQGLDSLAYIAFGIALGASGLQVPDPKHLAG